MSSSTITGRLPLAKKPVLIFDTSNNDVISSNKTQNTDIASTIEKPLNPVSGSTNENKGEYRKIYKVLTKAQGKNVSLALTAEEQNKHAKANGYNYYDENGKYII